MITRRKRSLELGTVLCTKCYSVPNEPCRERGPDGWMYRREIHQRRRHAQVLTMPDNINVIIAGKLIGLTPDATRAAIEEGTFPMPVTTCGRRRTVTRTTVLQAMRSRV